MCHNLVLGRLEAPNLRLEIHNKLTSLMPLVTIGASSVI